MVPTIPGTQEDRRLASYYQLETSECSHQTSEVQDGDPSLGPTLPYQGHVGHESGSQGCLSPRPCQPERPAMAEISGWGRGVSVPLPAFRPVHSSEGFHPSGQGGGFASETAGGEHVCVPGRLVHLQSDQGAVVDPYSYGHRGGDQVRFHYQLGEISPGPHTVTHLPRCTLRPPSWSSSADTRSCRQSDQLCRTTPISASGRSFGVVASVGVDGELCGPNPTVQVPHATHSTSPIGSLSTVTTRGRSHGTGYPDNQGGPGVVDFQGSPSCRGSISLSSSRLRGDHGRVGVGLGGSYGRSQGLGSVEPRGGSHAYQPLRALGCRSNAQGLRGATEELQDSYSIGQFNRSSIYQQARGHQIPHALPSFQGHATMVFQSPDRVGRCSHCGRIERSCGQSVQGPILRSHGVVPITSSGSGHLRCEVPSFDGPVCEQHQLSAPSVLLSQTPSESVRCGRSVVQLGGDGGLRLPSNFPSASGHTEGGGGGLRDNPHRPLLAPSVVVSSASRSTSGRPTSAPVAGGPALDARLPRPVTERRAPEVDCLALVRQRLQAEGLSQESADLAARGRRGSTLRAYSLRLGPYVRWCESREISPAHATVGQVADFLRNRFEAGLESATVRNYKSAILAIHQGFEDGSTLAESIPIRLLLDGMFNTRPPKRRIVPAWDLNKVLDYIKGAPFEPMVDASFQAVTSKTLILLALAAPRRCSEFQALAVGPHIVFSNRGVKLYFRPGFLAKNERPSFSAEPIFVPTISLSSSVHEDRLWCPVRALRYYLRRSKSLRGPTEQLFIITKRPYSKASKNTLARWICDLIRDAGAVQGGGRVTAHSTRSIATSVAFHRGINVSAILETVAWKSETTFSSVYLRDMCPSADFSRAVLLRPPTTSH